MNNGKHIKLSLTLALAITILGTGGYMVIEGWGISDALYMAVITLGTVGFREIHQVSDMGRWFTIVLIITGVGTLSYTAGSIVDFMVQGRIMNIMGRRRVDKKIARLKNHYIVCGYGRIGRVLCRHLRERPVPVVVVEKSSELVPSMESDGVLFLNADAADEANLQKVGIQDAAGLVAVLGTDADNVFLILTARQLSRDLYIVSRASKDQAKAKLRAAGANRVESPYDMGALSMAQRILRPTVTNFLDLAYGDSREDIQMEEIPVDENSPLVDLALKDSGIRQQFNSIIIAIKEADGAYLFNPSFRSQIKAGDTVIAVGEIANLKKLEKVLSPKRG